MKLNQLIEGLDARLFSGEADVDVLDVVEDSRQATPGCLFIARKGMTTDGARFAQDACEAGAVAVAVEGDETLFLPTQVAQLGVADGGRFAAETARRLYAYPDRDLSLVGVTGTNGKTTTACLTHHLLRASACGCGLISTVSIDDGVAESPAQMTTPPSTTICRLLRTMVEHDCRAAAMEVSSHALTQGRVHGLHFRVGIFTNLSGDHLDYHGSMSAYADAKAKLFEMMPVDGMAVINGDDASAVRMIERCKAQVLHCSMRDESAECFAEVTQGRAAGSDIRLRGPWGALECTLPLVGQYNVMNALQATAAAWAIGAEVHQLEAGLNCAPAPPGRLQPVSDPAGELMVLVDYAHTDDALDNALRAVRAIVPAGAHLWAVFGCGGDRDRTKRPRMAQVACRHADRIVITSDNPRTENPRSIVEEILAGVTPERLINVLVEVDRAKAINLAVQCAEVGDVVLIAGKGHEDYQIIGTSRYDFDDRAVAEGALKKRAGKAVTS